MAFIVPLLMSTTSASLPLRTSKENLLSRLFSYRVREKLNPAENFLTEALAYLLATDESVQGPVIDLLSNGRVKGAHSLSVETQSLQKDDEGEKRCIVDAIVCGLDDSGAEFELWIENKWGSGVDADQLDKYCDILASRSVHFAFVSPSLPDVEVARLRLLNHAGGTSSARVATTWAEIQAKLGDLSGLRSTRIEFADFLQMNGLGRISPATLQRAKEYAAFRELQKADGRSRGRVGDSDDFFLRDLRALCARALSINIAGGDPHMKGVEVHDGWGRVACITDDRRLSVGLLYNPLDHCTAFQTSSQPLDIIVRVQAPPKASTLSQRRESLSGIRLALEPLGFNCDPGGGPWTKNHHTVLLGHYRQGFPFDAGSGEKQSEYLACVFAKVWQVLNDEQFAAVLSAIGSY